MASSELMFLFSFPAFHTSLFQHSFGGSNEGVYCMCSLDFASLPGAVWSCKLYFFSLSLSLLWTLFFRRDLETSILASMLPFNISF